MGGEMPEILVAMGAGRNMRGASRRLGTTGTKLVKVTPGGLEKATGGETSSGRVTVLGPVRKSFRGNGLERLEKAADQRLGRDSEALADLLLGQAKEGKVGSVRLLVTLAEHRLKRKPQEKKKKKPEGPTWDELLNSEPKWVEEKPEVGDVWACGGWNKPGGRFVGERTEEGEDSGWSVNDPILGAVWNGEGWKNPKTRKVMRLWYETKKK